MGRLTEVLRPDGDTVSFTYDALGRRLSKSYRDKTTRWAWDGNVPLHEWLEDNRTSSGFTKTPDDAVSSEVSPANERATPDLDDLVDQLLQEVNGELNTYLYEPGSFTPLAKLIPTRDLSVVADHLGTPAALYDSEGRKVWENRMDIYGRPLWTDGLALDMCFRYPGQYEDNETGLSYNRFRYYDAGEGVYISRDPIGLVGGNPTLYGYVGDVNGWSDPFGLALKPENGYLRGKRHGIGVSDKDAQAEANRSGQPYGRWGNKTDLSHAGELADTIEPGGTPEKPRKGGFVDFPINDNSKSIVFYPTDSPDVIDARRPTHYRLRNNGTGTFHGFPIDDGAKPIFNPGKLKGDCP